MSGQDKATEQQFYDELFRKRGRFDQFQNEIYEKVAREARNGTSGKLALDIGCGSGTQSICLLQQGFKVLSADLSFEAVKVTRETLEQSGKPLLVLNADVEYLTLPDQSVDACICSLFLHHFENLDGVAKELHRVMRPGGVVVATDANAHNPFSYLFFNVVHKMRTLPGVTANQRAISSRELREAFGRQGFGDFRFTSLTTELKREWLGNSLSYTLNYYARAILLKLTNLLLPPLSRGNLLLTVFRRLPES